MTVNYLLVFSFSLYRMYMNLCLLMLGCQLSLVISNTNIIICFVDDRSNLPACVIILLSTAFYIIY